MTLQSFSTFYNEFLHQPENTGLVELINTAKSEETFASKAIEVGSKHGFTFSIDDIKQVMATSARNQPDSLELSDLQLQSVAGGMVRNKGRQPDGSYDTVMCPW